jgi:hypothetical protein
MIFELVKIFGPFPPYILKYNALRFGAESLSFFRLIPEHIVTAVLKKSRPEGGGPVLSSERGVLYFNT